MASYLVAVAFSMLLAEDLADPWAADPEVWQTLVHLSLAVGIPRAVGPEASSVLCLCLFHVLIGSGRRRRSTGEEEDGNS